jgi:hypothetical protein
MVTQLERCLRDLESRIDPEVEADNYRQWVDFLEGRCRAEVFTPTARKPSAPRVEWPGVSINQAIDDIDLMVLHQFQAISQTLEGGSGLRLNVRCNYGTGILSSLFGCELFVMPEETDTLPTTRPLESMDRVKALLDAGVPDIHSALGAKVFRCAERFGEVFQAHPILQEYVEFYHPDLQGPIDVVELVWGSGMFVGFYDEPDLLRDLLDLVTRTYIEFLRAWHAIVPPRGDYSSHWGLLMKGHVMLRNDSLMNLSPETYTDFIRPKDGEVLDTFGGGAIHFCGRGDHFIAAMSETPGLTGVNLSQPHLNDMETIYRNTVDKGICVIGLHPQAAGLAGRDLHRRVHCF